MLQNCSKIPLIAATVPTSLLRTKMSTSSGDELNMGHFHCRNRLGMITGTSKTIDELRNVIDQGIRCCTQPACNNLHSKHRSPCKKEHGELPLRHDRGVDDCLHTDSNEEAARPANRDIDHQKKYCAGETLWSSEQGKPWESASAP